MYVYAYIVDAVCLMLPLLDYSFACIDSLHSFVKKIPVIKFTTTVVCGVVWLGSCITSCSLKLRAKNITQLAKMTVDYKFIELTADVFRRIL